jgi:hypothetical protein
MIGELININFPPKFTGKFQQYDSGCSMDEKGSKDEECDRATDGQEYDLSKITVPIDLHYADNDWLASPAVRMTVQTLRCLRNDSVMINNYTF